MSEPRRWLDDPDGLSPEERRVLEVGLETRAPKLAKDAVKSAVFAALPPPIPPPGTVEAAGTAGTAAAGAAGVAGAGVKAVAAATLGALAKSTAIGFALGVGTTVTWVALQPTGDVGRGTPSNVVSAAPTADVPAPAVVRSPVGSGLGEATPSSRSTPLTPPERERATAFPSDDDSSPSGDATGAPPRQAPSVGAFPEVDSTLDAATTESRRLAEARALLRNNDARAALAALEGVRRDYPRGVLVQEREVLVIEALLAAGDETGAKARAREFVTRYPASPHAASARRVLERP
jgi:hypothetical protein